MQASSNSSLSDVSGYYEQDHSCNTSTKGPATLKCAFVADCGCKMIKLGLCILGFWLPYAISLK